MHKDQLNSGVRSVLKIIGAALIAHGATVSASIVNSEDAIGVALLIAGLIWSHYNHQTTA